MTTTETRPPATTDEPEPVTDDAQAEAEPEPEPDAAATAAGGELFDSSAYEREDLAIPKVDGEGIDKIRLAFTGSVMLDRSNPADVALYNRAMLARDLELRISGRVARVATGYTTGKEGDLDAVVGERTIKVDSVWILDPETL